MCRELRAASLLTSHMCSPCGLCVRAERASVTCEGNVRIITTCSKSYIELLMPIKTHAGGVRTSPGSRSHPTHHVLLTHTSTPRPIAKMRRQAPAKRVAAACAPPQRRPPCHRRGEAATVSRGRPDTQGDRAGWRFSDPRRGRAACACHTHPPHRCSSR